MRTAQGTHHMSFDRWGNTSHRYVPYGRVPRTGGRKAAASLAKYLREARRPHGGPAQEAAVSQAPHQGIAPSRRPETTYNPRAAFLRERTPYRPATEDISSGEEPTRRPPSPFLYRNRRSRNYPKRAYRPASPIYKRRGEASPEAASPRKKRDGNQRDRSSTPDSRQQEKGDSPQSPAAATQPPSPRGSITSIEARRNVWEWLDKNSKTIEGVQGPEAVTAAEDAGQPSADNLSREDRGKKPEIPEEGTPQGEPDEEAPQEERPPIPLEPVVMVIRETEDRGPTPVNVPDEEEKKKKPAGPPNLEDNGDSDCEIVEALTDPPVTFPKPKNIWVKRRVDSRPLVLALKRASDPGPGTSEAPATPAPTRAPTPSQEEADSTQAGEPSNKKEDPVGSNDLPEDQQQAPDSPPPHEY